jgi:hypothetical protein
MNELHCFCIFSQFARLAVRFKRTVINLFACLLVWLVGWLVGWSIICSILTSVYLRETSRLPDDDDNNNDDNDDDDDLPSRLCKVSIFAVIFIVIFIALIVAPAASIIRHFSWRTRGTAEPSHPSTQARAYRSPRLNASSGVCIPFHGQSGAYPFFPQSHLRTPHAFHQTPPTSSHARAAFHTYC